MKLIAADLDGTLLLKGETKLNRVNSAAIVRLLEKDMLIAVASGRNYGELKRILEVFEDKIYFIANDGALVMRKGKAVFEKPIEPEHLRQFDNAENVVFHCKYVSYVKSPSKRFIRQIKEQYFGHIAETESVDRIKEPVYKISVYDTKTEVLGLNNTYKDNTICEYVENNINKGVALTELLKFMKTEKAEAVAVGDNTNDIEMLKAVGRAYVIASAPPKVKRYGKSVDGFDDFAEILLKE